MILGVELWEMDYVRSAAILLLMFTPVIAVHVVSCRVHAVLSSHGHSSRGIRMTYAYDPALRQT